jgi:hypothetical protein
MFVNMVIEKTNCTYIQKWKENIRKCSEFNLAQNQNTQLQSKSDARTETFANTWISLISCGRALYNRGTLTAGFIREICKEHAPTNNSALCRVYIMRAYTFCLLSFCIFTIQIKSIPCFSCQSSLCWYLFVSISFLFYYWFFHRQIILLHHLGGLRSKL